MEIIVVMVGYRINFACMSHLLYIFFCFFSMGMFNLIN